jgi:hypothetical protein
VGEVRGEERGGEDCKVEVAWRERREKRNGTETPPLVALAFLIHTHIIQLALVDLELRGADDLAGGHEAEPDFLTERVNGEKG